MKGCRVGGDLIWTNLQDAPQMKRYLNISGVTVQGIIDDEVSWPAKGKSPSQWAHPIGIRICGVDAEPPYERGVS